MFHGETILPTMSQAAQGDGATRFHGETILPTMSQASQGDGATRFHGETAILSTTSQASLPLPNCKHKLFT